HHHDVFGEHHLPHAPEAVHDFVGLHRVTLPDAHEDEVVEDAFGRQRDVCDLGEVHPEYRQEKFYRCAANIKVFHRGHPYDGRRINRFLPMRDGGDVEDGIRLGQSVVAGVVAERAFLAQRLARINVAFDDEVG